MDAPPIQYARTEDGVNIAYWTLGNGAPVVLAPIHIATPVSWWIEMDETIGFLDRLAEHNSVVLFDHRGTGLSDKTTVVPSIDDQVADIDAVVDALGRERIALWGTLFSTPAVITYAVQRPDRLSHLIIWNGAPSWEEYIQSPQAQTLAVVREHGDWQTITETVMQVTYGWSKPELAHRSAALLRDSVDQETWLAAINRNTMPDVSDRFPSVSTPTLVLARQDPYFGICGSQLLGAKIPDTRMIVLPGTSTYVLAEDVEAVC